MLALVVICLTVCELYLRRHGYDLSYFDDPALWLHKREHVYEPADKATVFIGSSRIKFDLDVELWEKTTGNQAIQLACVGSTPLPILQELANDSLFKGHLVVDVTEGLFFSLAAGNAERPTENLKYLKDHTPAQTASFHINHLLESQFVFLDKENLALSQVLKSLPLEDRPGVFDFKGFPSDFGRVKFNRQEYMTDKLASDTSLSNKVIAIWDGFRKMNKKPPLSGHKLDSVLNLVKQSTDKIKARGGQVLFVRTPSSGHFLEAETNGFPREKYWERILTTTQCPGVHFADYPELSRLKCPELSHLSLAGATVFTKEFIRILRDEKGWTNLKSAALPQ